MEGIWAELAIIVLLILGNGFFAGSELAIVSARRGRMAQLGALGDKRAHLVEQLQADPHRFLATVQIGVTLVGTMASAVGGATAVEVLKPLLEKAKRLKTMPDPEVAWGIKIRTEEETDYFPPLKSKDYPIEISKCLTASHDLYRNDEFKRSVTGIAIVFDADQNDEKQADSRYPPQDVFPRFGDGQVHHHDDNT